MLGLVVRDKLANPVDGVDIVWPLKVVTAHLPQFFENIAETGNLRLRLEIVSDLLLVENPFEHLANSIILLVLSRLDHVDIELFRIHNGIF